MKKITFLIGTALFPLSIFSQSSSPDKSVKVTLKSGMRLSYSANPGSSLYAAFLFPIQNNSTGMMPMSSAVQDRPSLGNFRDKSCWVIVANKNNTLPSTMVFQLGGGVVPNARLSWQQSSKDSNGKTFWIASISLRGENGNATFSSGPNYIHEIMCSFESQPSESEFSRLLSNTLGFNLEKVETYKEAPTEPNVHN